MTKAPYWVCWSLRPRILKYLILTIIYTSIGLIISNKHTRKYDLFQTIGELPKQERSELIQSLDQQLPNLPLTYLYDGNPKMINESCAKSPTLYDLHFSNIYWQLMSSSNGSIYLYSAFLDRRKNNLLGASIRLLGFMYYTKLITKTFCQIWFAEHQEPVIAEVLEYNYIWREYWSPSGPGEMQPYMFTCQVPSTHSMLVPLAVSLVENACDMATNLVKVTFNTLKSEELKKGKVAVCIKLLRRPYDNLSVKLVEWIEILKLLGADKIYTYIWEAHPNASKVLTYYDQQGKIVAVPMTMPGILPSLQGLLHLYLAKWPFDKQIAVIPYNDCLMRNMYTHEYVSIFDIDEVIMPLKKTSWGSMMEDVVAQSQQTTNQTWASFNFRSVYFLPELLKRNTPSPHLYKDIPPHLHMMHNIFRSGNYTPPGHYIKSFHNTDLVVMTHNHFPMICYGSCDSHEVDTEVGHLQHYRDDCHGELMGVCEEVYKSGVVMEKAIWRFKDEMISRTTDTLGKLGFFNK